MILFRHIPVYYIGWFGGAWIAAMVFRYKKKVRLSREGIDISQDVQEKVWMLKLILNNLSSVLAGITGLIAASYVWYLNHNIKKTTKENVDLKESLSISRITKDIYKQQLQNKSKLDAEKESLKSRLDDVLGD